MSNNCVSVIVPVYNVEKYIDEALTSLTGQTHQNLEIVLIDDCSPDSSGALCDKWASKDKRIKVVHKSPNEGVSAARNTALKLISGDYIFFMDPDDVISPHTIKTLLQVLTENDADVALCREIAFNESEESPVFSDDINSEVTIENFEEYTSHFCDNFTGPVCWTCNKLFKRSVVGDIRFQNFRVGEDTVFNSQVSLNVHKAVWSDNRFYGYRIREGSATAAGKRDSTLESAKSWLCSYEIFKTPAPVFADRYMIYLLGKFANLRAQARFYFGKKSEAKMKLFFNDVYDKNASKLLKADNKDRLKLFLARYAFGIYYLISSRQFRA